MNTQLLDRIVEAVLYEGYILYPYRASAKKNRERFTFGRVYPEAYFHAQQGAEPCAVQTQCLMRRTPGATPRLHVHLRFLHPLLREVGQLDGDLTGIDYQVVPRLVVDGNIYQTWHEAVERDVEISLDAAEPGSASAPVEVASLCRPEEIRDAAGNAAAVIMRRQRPLSGRLDVMLETVDDCVSLVTVTAINLTEMRRDCLDDTAEVLMRTFASTHLILDVEGGEFFSMTDPPAGYEAAAAACQHHGVWPVLVGDPAKNERTTMLASPIILEDYPKIAPESAGSLYDSTEIDEILTLRILTMTDEEKLEMRDVDQRARDLLERTEALDPDHLWRMHGTLRVPQPAMNPFEAEVFGAAAEPLAEIMIKGIPVQPGDAVVIRPKSKADAFDMLVAGKSATIEALEVDAEGKVHAAVVLDDDPGRDLQGRDQQSL